jgi:citrate lyase subunit beta/citryl-CoA lyase
MSDIRDSVNSMTELLTARSFLFAPGSDDHKLRHALASAADAVIADLEDAVTPTMKTAARQRVADAYSEGTDRPGQKLVRVNAVGTEWHEDDLAMIAGLDVDGVVLPKATARGATAVAAALSVPIIAIVETAEGLRGAYAIAGSPSVVGLILGAVDLGVALGLEPRPDGQELLYARSSVVVDSAAAGLRGPIDRVWLDVRDPTGLVRDCALARSLGFRGKACVHPDQVEIVNVAFSPSERELERAREVVTAFEQAERAGSGVIALGGEMIDLPVVERARRLIADNERRVLDAD